ncbi:transposase [Streptomyces sp. CB01881]|nr:transposase [Streptomyces sp. CB01881]
MAPVRGDPAARIPRAGADRPRIRPPTPHSVPAPGPAPPQALRQRRDRLDHPPPRPPLNRREPAAQGGPGTRPGTRHHRRARQDLRRADERSPRPRAQGLDHARPAGPGPALRGFATGLLQDLDAVVASLTLHYSSGAVEGHNNKIKMLKRQMFGRANFDLLRIL